VSTLPEQPTPPEPPAPPPPPAPPAPPVPPAPPAGPDTGQNAAQQKVLDEGRDAHTAGTTYGVVFVHGIGSQTQSSTLREQADPLISWLRKWHAAAASEANRANPDPKKELTVVWSLLSYGADIKGPARLRLHLPEYDLPQERKDAAAENARQRKKEHLARTKKAESKGWTPDTPTNIVRPAQFKSQNWILTEGWWASRLTAPSFPVMLRWSAHQFRRAVIRLVRAFLLQDREVVFDKGLDRRQRAWRSRPARTVEWVSGLLVIILYSGVGLIGIGAIWLLYLIAQIPIPGLENFVVLKVIRPLVLEGVGDVYTYLYDEVQALHVRRSVEEAVTWLVDQEGCQHVIIVAHSGGTVIAYDTLGNRGDAGCKHDVEALAKVKALVTVGSALNNAWGRGVGPQPPMRLKHQLCEHTRWTNIWADYDLVAGGSMDRSIDPPRIVNEDVRVTNSLSVLLDHGGYWDNTEEYLPRIAQLVESPADRHLSRFWDPLRTEWAERRRDRVTTLVGWRLTGFVVFGLALLVKLIQRRTAVDGSRLLDIAEQLPLVGGALKGFKDAVTGAPDVLKDLGPDAVGLLFWAAASALAYIAVVRVVYEPWSEREGLRSIYPSVNVKVGEAPRDPPSQWRDIAGRTGVVVLALVTLAVGAYLLNVTDISFALALLVFAGFIVWWLVWLKYGRTRLRAASTE
jgi:hypothetical protein